MSEATQPQPQRRLGRGLSALLGGNGPSHAEIALEASPSELRNIPLAQLSPNPFQPRQLFDAEALGELALSIKEHGVLQPILVRESNGGYQVIAGERRWKASQKAGLTVIPCRVVDVIDKTACEFALEENLKRKDLSDLEKAQAFRDYISQFECTIEELAKQLSMSRSAVNNLLRLLDLSAPVKAALNSGKISAGHARALLTLSEAEQIELCGRIQAEGMSVRTIESVVKKIQGRDTAPEPQALAAGTAALLNPAPQVAVPSQETSDSTASENHAQTGSPKEDSPIAVNPEPESFRTDATSPHTATVATDSTTTPESDRQTTIPMSEAESHRTHHVNSLETQLRDLLGVQVEIQLNSKDSGKIHIPFSSNQEFERVLNILRRSAA